MIEENFELNTLIGGWYIDETVCDNLLKLWPKIATVDNPDYSNGKFRTNDGESKIDRTIKYSDDVSFSHDNPTPEIQSYIGELSKCCQRYEHKFGFTQTLNAWTIVENFNFQHYVKGGGFFNWHYEQNGNWPTNDRVLAWMTYLNDVEEGGTEFFHQGITTVAKKGLTLIWPAGFTHAHRGQTTPKTGEKWIMTGWFSWRDKHLLRPEVEDLNNFYEKR